MFPNPQCGLIFKNNFELLIAVILSAQTTDKAVNKVTKELFLKYPTPRDLAAANILDIEKIVFPLGFYKKKSRNIIECAKIIYKEFDSKVCNNFKDLISIPGVGEKTANVVLNIAFKKDTLGVDTHILRVSKKLGITKSDKPSIVNKDLMKFFSKYDKGKLHLLLINFGRYICEAKKPKCYKCQLIDNCNESILK